MTAVSLRVRSPADSPGRPKEAIKDWRTGLDIGPLGFARNDQYGRISESQLLPGKMKYALQVVGLGEQIDQVHLLDAVSSAEQASQITRGSRRIAGDVGHPVRSQSDETLDHTFPQTAPWRVHHHEIGPRLTDRAPQETGGSRLESLPVRRGIVEQISIRSL